MVSDYFKGFFNVLFLMVVWFDRDGGVVVIKFVVGGKCVGCIMMKG